VTRLLLTDSPVSSVRDVNHSVVNTVANVVTAVCAVLLAIKVL